MSLAPAAEDIKRRVSVAAHTLGTRDPVSFVGGLIDRAFELPRGDPQYAANNLTPGAVPFEPSFSEREPDALRFTVQPAGPDAYPLQRRDEATREMRRLIDAYYGRDALHWFDRASEPWRTFFSHPNLYYGAWFGSSYDRDGLRSSKVYYELSPTDLATMPLGLGRLAKLALGSMTNLVPLFSTLSAYRSRGRQRITLLCPNLLRLADLGPLLQQLGLSHQLPSIMQIVGLTLGGRFTLPPRSLLIGLSGTPEDPELKLEVLLGMIDDVPRQFPELLRLGLAERPQQLRAMERWYQAFTPEDSEHPGSLSVLSVQVSRDTPARVAVYLRPIEFELAPELDLGAPAG